MVHLEEGRVTRKTCCNSSMLRHLHKHLLVAKSLIPGAGWGLFTKNSIRKNECIQQYVSEVVSQEEAERRGAVYDKKNLSFLFNLNNELVLDALRKGNKSKFANHSTTPNCYVRIAISNGEHHVGIFAKEDIVSGSELTFDYGYTKDAFGDYFQKEAIVVGWMKDPSQAKQIQQMNVARRVGGVTKASFVSSCKLDCATPTYSGLKRGCNDTIFDQGVALFENRIKKYEYNRKRTILSRSK